MVYHTEEDLRDSLCSSFDSRFRQLEAVTSALQECEERCLVQEEMYKAQLNNLVSLQMRLAVFLMVEHQPSILYELFMLQSSGQVGFARTGSSMQEAEKCDLEVNKKALEEEAANLGNQLKIQLEETAAFTSELQEKQQRELRLAYDRQRELNLQLEDRIKQVSLQFWCIVINVLA